MSTPDELAAENERLKARLAAQEDRVRTTKWVLMHISTDLEGRTLGPGVLPAVCNLAEALLEEPKPC